MAHNFLLMCGNALKFNSQLRFLGGVFRAASKLVHFLGRHEGKTVVTPSQHYIGTILMVAVECFTATLKFTIAIGHVKSTSFCYLG